LLETIDLIQLATHFDIPGLTPAKLKERAEAATMCLAENDHFSGTLFTLSDISNTDSKVPTIVLEITDQLRAAHADLHEATEKGAEAIAFILSLEFTSYTIVQRARKGDGFDYWLGTAPLKLDARLEVSGILQGRTSDIRKRIKQKSNQTKQSDELMIPAFICVVEFGRPYASFTKR